MYDMHEIEKVLSESLVDRVLAMDNLGWASLVSGNVEDDGLDLDTLKRISKTLRELTASHPLFTRGDHLRGAYIFGRGMTIAGAEKPKMKRILENSQNQRVIFGVEAFEVASRALFTDGLFCVIRNTTTNRFIQVPLSQISAVVTNPEDNTDWWYIVRSWSSNGEEYQKVIPVAGHYNDDPQKSIKDASGRIVPVDQTYRAYVKHTNRQAGWTFGIPDALPALIHALQYTGYLKDQAVLVNALSKFAWNITSGNARRTDQIKTRVQKIGGEDVGTASIGERVTGVGVPSAQVNFNNGQPLAALVAASFGVPVIALLSSPGATGGSYGAAQTLDAPTLKGFEVIQQAWGGFFVEIVRDCGAREASVGFASIESDPAYRQITSIATMFELGLIHGDEARLAAMDILDAPVLHESFTTPPLLANVSAVSRQGDAADGAVSRTTNPGGDTNNDE